jgi:hypothetical protein
MRNIIIISLITLGSCNIGNRKKILVENLTDSNYKYWDIVEFPKLYNKKECTKYPLYCYYFNKKGGWIFYKYQDTSLVEYSVQDIVGSQNWEFLTDSTIRIGDRLAHISKLTKDTFIYIDDKWKFKIMMAKHIIPLNSVESSKLKR